MRKIVFFVVLFVLAISVYAIPHFEADLFDNAVLVYQDPDGYRYQIDYETFSLVLGTEHFDPTENPFDQFEDNLDMAIFEFQFVWNEEIDLSDPQVMLNSALGFGPYGAIFAENDLHFFRPGRMDYLEIEDGILRLKGTLNFYGETQDIQFEGPVTSLAINEHPGVK